jgi:CRP-like cAMP-binding protein
MHAPKSPANQNPCPELSEQSLQEDSFRRQKLNVCEDSVFGTVISSIDTKEYEIIAKEQTEVIIIDYDRLFDKTNLEKRYYNEFILNMYSIINDKLQEKNERIRILTKKTIRNKLLEYCKIQYSKNHSKHIYLPYNFSDLADYLAVDRSAMSRELKYMKEEGFIEVKGKRITILY